LVLGQDGLPADITEPGRNYGVRAARCYGANVLNTFSICQCGARESNAKNLLHGCVREIVGGVIRMDSQHLFTWL
jgi:hypothetical protein